MKLPDDVVFRAVVQQRDLEAGLALGAVDKGGLPGDGLHHAGDGVGLKGGEIPGNLVANAGVHHAGLPDYPGELPGVHAVETGDVPLFQKALQIPAAAEVGGVAAPLPDHIALDVAGSLEILRDDSVVSNEGIGLQNDLSRVAGVRQGFHIAAHTGGEDQLPHGPGLSAETGPRKHLPVRQYQIAFFHGCLPR